MDPEAEPVDAPQTAWDEFSSALPTWAWAIIGSNLAIVVLSIVGRLLIPAESVVLDYWGTTQLVGGIALVIGLHITCFVMIASSDSDMGILDMVVNPLKAWFRTFEELPKRLWMVVGGSNGIVLSLAAVLIVGGIPWERLWDWGIEAPTKSSLIDAVTSAASAGSSDKDDLEDAIGDFAGNEIPGDQKPTTPPKAPEPKPQLKTDCLIIGFKLDDFEQIKEVLIATETRGRMVYAGKIVPKLGPEEKLALKRALMRSRTGTPLVRTGQVATWVRPRFPCRVSYTEQAQNGRLLEMEWEELLPELQLGW